MFDLTPQYAPDLEWMLQSGQVPRDLLLEALLQEYYARVYHLALSILDDRAAAQSAAGQTFARALLDQHRYRSQDGVEFWLFRIALEACQPFQKRLKFRRSVKAALPRLSQPDDFGDSCPETLEDARLWLALDSLEEHVRQLALLHYANGWQPDRIAALFEVAESDVEAVLAAARQLVAQPSALDASLPSGDPLPPEQLDPCLVQSLQRRWPDQEFTPAELEAQAAMILRRLRWLGFRQTKALAVLEIGIMALIILLAFATIWGADLLFGAGPTPTPSAPLPTHLVTRVVTQLVTATPIPLLEIHQNATSTPIQIAKSNYTEVRPGESLQDVADRLSVTVEELRDWNRLPDYAEIQAGQRLINPQFALSLQPPAAPTLSPVEPLPTLAASVTTQQLVNLLNRRNESLQCFWFDGSIIDYGPQSYIGPARQTHVQAWINETQVLVLTGAYGLLPGEAILIPGTKTQLVAEPAAHIPWFTEWRTLTDLDGPAMQSFNRFSDALFNPNLLYQASNLDVLGREDLDGRSTLKLGLFASDGSQIGRLWLDDSLPQLMRRIDYMPGTGNAPTIEYRINSLDLNVVFPTALFDMRLPWRGGFAADYQRRSPFTEYPPSRRFSRQRPILTAQPPPDGFDPSHSPLTFQYAGSYAGFSPEAQYQVFAGQYFIGQTYFGDPWKMICDRSPDGALDRLRQPAVPVS